MEPPFLPPEPAPRFGKTISSGPLAHADAAAELRAGQAEIFAQARRARPAVLEAMKAEGLLGIASALSPRTSVEGMAANAIAFIRALGLSQVDVLGFATHAARVLKTLAARQDESKNSAMLS
jgi:hypothetical protein